MYSCPSREVLVDFLADRLTAPLRTSVAEHFAQCSSCKSVADRVTDDVTLQRLYRSHCDMPSEPAPGNRLAELRKQLYALSDRTPESTLGSQSSDDRPRVTETKQPAVLGRYHLLERLGAGGSGIVYRAHDTQLNRPVALRLPRSPALADPEGRVRFLREARAAAGLHHPNIVALYDAGECDGVCYLASAYCPGQTLAQWLSQRDTPAAPDEAARIVLALAEAVDHAHENGVLHRDIKPQNVLLDPTLRFQNLPFSPKVTDFSIAKLADGEAAETATEVLLGTPQYIAPELVAGRRDQLGPACDIYALGVVLYELLTGQAPIEGTSPADTLRRVLSDEPIRPRKLAPAVPRDLEAICHVCLEKAPERRFRSAGLLAADLQRYLQRKPTVARPIGPLERVYRWVQRRPAAAGLIAVSAVASLVIVLGLTLYNRRLGALNLDLQRSNVNLEGALVDAKRATTRAELSEDATQQLLYASDMRLAGRAWKDGDIRGQTDLLRRHIPRDGQPDRRGLEWRFLWNLAVVKPRTLDAFTGDVYSLCLSPDRKRVAAAGKDGEVRIYDLATGTLVCSIETGQKEVNGVAFSPDGRRLVSAGDDGTVRVWRLENQAELLKIAAHPKLAYQAIFTADGATLITGGDDPTIRFWDAVTGEALGSLVGDSESVEALALSRDGLLLAAAGFGGHTRVFDMSERRELLALKNEWPGFPYSGVAFSPDGQLIVACDLQKVVWVWATKTGQQLAIGRHLAQVHSVAISTDGRYFATGDAEGVIRLWDLKAVRDAERAENGDPLELESLRQWRGHDGRVFTMTFDEADRFITAGADGKVQTWRLSNIAAPPAVKSDLDKLIYPVFTHDRRLLAHKSGTNTFGWDLQNGPKLDRSIPQPFDGSFISTDRSGKLLAVLTERNEIELWDLAQRSPHAPREANVSRSESPTMISRWNFGESQDPRAFRLSPDGELLAVLVRNPQRQVQLFEARTGILRTTFAMPTTTVGPMCFSPDGQRIAASADNEVLMWTHQNGDVLRIPRTHSNLTDLNCSPDGTVLATTGSDRLVKLWSLKNGELLGTLSGHRGRVNSLDFSPDGRTLVTTGSDGALKAWNVAAREELFDIYKHNGGLEEVRVSADGRWLVCTTHFYGKILLFDLGESLSPPTHDVEPSGP